jgi:hypothetical protein
MLVRHRRELGSSNVSRLGLLALALAALGILLVLGSTIRDKLACADSAVRGAGGGGGGCGTAAAAAAPPPPPSAMTSASATASASAKASASSARGSGAAATTTPPPSQAGFVAGVGDFANEVYRGAVLGEYNDRPTWVSTGAAIVVGLLGATNPISLAANTRDTAATYDKYLRGEASQLAVAGAVAGFVPFGKLLKPIAKGILALRGGAKAAPKVVTALEEASELGQRRGQWEAAHPRVPSGPRVIDRSSYAVVKIEDGVAEKTFTSAKNADPVMAARHTAHNTAELRTDPMLAEFIPETVNHLPARVRQAEVRGNTWFELSQRDARLGDIAAKNADDVAEEAARRFPHVPIDHSHGNFLFDDSGRVLHWFDPVYPKPMYK